MNTILVGRNAPRLSSRAMIALVLLLGFLGACRNLLESQNITSFFDEYSYDVPSRNAKKGTVAYAVTVTHFEDVEHSYFKHLDRAAVLHQSIKLAMQKSRYDYHMYAFVHPEASDAQPFLERLGYRVQIRDTPFNISAVDNFDLVDAQRIGCCGEKEYLKLYSYLLLDYPVVVHLDLDTLVLKPMDEVFDFFASTQPNAATKLYPGQAESFAGKYAMWFNKTLDAAYTHWKPRILETPEEINFMFTRDYNMVDPPNLLPYQVGVQGGFLVVRPNQEDFNRMVYIIKSGGEFKESMWGYETLERNGYGNYYGAATIQGLASYYYDHYEKSEHSLELNRCKYNTMVDDPRQYNKGENKTYCTTLEENCEDCRQTKVEEIYTSHFTECGKPEYCENLSHDTLCGKLMHEWHKVRFNLEMEWIDRYSADEFPYIPDLKGSAKPPALVSKTLGHCDGERYIPMIFPTTASSNNDDEKQDVLI